MLSEYFWGYFSGNGVSGGIGVLLEVLLEVVSGLLLKSKFRQKAVGEIFSFQIQFFGT